MDKRTKTTRTKAWLIDKAARLARYSSERPYLKVVLSAVTTFSLAILGFFAPGLGFWWYALSALLIIVVAVGPVILEAKWEKSDDRDSDRIELRGRVLSRNLASLLRSLAAKGREVKRDRERTVDDIAGKIVRDLPDIFGEDSHVRCSIYRLSEDKNKMTSIATYGRPDQPRDFIRAKPRGRKAIEWLLSDNPEPKFEVDTDSVDHSKWEGTSEHYKTFISVAIMSDAERYGMLTLDAPRSGDLAESDSHVLQAFAAVMAIAIAEGQRGGRPPRSDRKR